MKSLPAILLGLLLLGDRAQAFSLLGPYEDWMQTTNGFRLPGDIGGPMNLGEEYRWNVPVVTYAFDQSFHNYFGSNGVAAVEEAIQILNDLPTASQINLSNYLSTAAQWNHAAGNQFILDLKSQTLYLLLEQLGLTQPVRSAFVIRGFTFPNGNLAVDLIQRNFDPFSFLPSSCVNDSCFLTNDFQVLTNGATIYMHPPIPLLADPFDDWLPSVLDGTSFPYGSMTPGSFYVNLTRDDAGGLRYLLHPENANVEILLPDVHGVGTNANSYVNQALRLGVEKITFVRPNYDTLLGQFHSPYTNQFTDRYITNSIIVHQQMERVVAKPDFTFRVETPDVPVQFSYVWRSGTCSWTNLAAINTNVGGAGPGVIRSPVNITFFALGPLIQSGDDFGGYVSVDDFRWGSFDGSTNPPTIYPASAAPDLTVSIQLVGTGLIGNYSWQLPVAIGTRVTFQTSTNLSEWVSVGSMTNRGGTMVYRHFGSAQTPQRFFRVRTD